MFVDPFCECLFLYRVSFICGKEKQTNCIRKTVQVIILKNASKKFNKKQEQIQIYISINFTRFRNCSLVSACNYNYVEHTTKYVCLCVWSLSVVWSIHKWLYLIAVIHRVSLLWFLFIVKSHLMVSFYINRDHNCWCSRNDICATIYILGYRQIYINNLIAQENSELYQ